MEVLSLMHQLFTLDIGGTFIKCAHVHADGTISQPAEIPTSPERGGRDLLDRTIALAQAAIAQTSVDGIAISTAGQVNPQNGSIRFATDNLPGWTGIALQSEMARVTGLPCAVVNDVNAVALGERWLGAARDTDDALVLSLGTGIGGAIISGGKLLLGKQGSAGEIGHLCLYPAGEFCTCGQHGCYERYASAAALLRRATLLRLPSTGKALFQSALEGDAQCRALIDSWLADVAQGIASLVFVLDPEIVIVGGGISAQGEAIAAPLEKKVRERVMPSYRGARIHPAQLGNDAGLLGAASLLFSRLG